jgi:hypothetical protein
VKGDLTPVATAVVRCTPFMVGAMLAAPTVAAAGGVVALGASTVIVRRRREAASGEPLP